jgi:protein-L-isoaspartate(D-aspartate) O-methyltransferase
MVAHSLKLAANALALAALFPVLALAADPVPTTEDAQRARMVADQIDGHGVTDPIVLAAMRTIPREQFVPDSLRPRAFEDNPLPIGEDQTISRPYIVAVMTAAIHPQKDMRVLEVGTGSGYQAAVLSACVDEVDTIEVIPSLGQRAQALLKKLGYRNIHARIGDGYDGWPERAPFDAILLTAAPPRVPQPLLDQLKVGGRLVAPVGKGVQNLVVMTKTAKGTVTNMIRAVKFVPMTGKAAGKTGG